MPFNFMIRDFPHEVYRTYCSDMRWFEDDVLRKIFKPIGHIHKMCFQKVLVGEGKRYHGEVKYYQLFITFTRLELPIEEFWNFKCKILTAKDYERKDFTFHFEAFKNLEIDDVCVFNIFLTLDLSKKLEECFDWESDLPLSKRMDKIIEEAKKTYEHWSGKIVKFEYDCIYVELEDLTIERINLEEGDRFRYITFNGMPTYSM